MPGWSGEDSLPFFPSKSIRSGCTVTVTPAGIVMGFLPTLDMVCSPRAYQMLQRTSPPAPCSSQDLPVMTPRDVETTTRPRPSRTLGTESLVQ